MRKVLMMTSKHLCTNKRHILSPDGQLQQSFGGVSVSGPTVNPEQKWIHSPEPWNAGKLGYCGETCFQGRGSDNQYHRPETRCPGFASDWPDNHCPGHGSDNRGHWPDTRCGSDNKVQGNWPETHCGRDNQVQGNWTKVQGHDPEIDIWAGILTTSRIIIKCKDVNNNTKRRTRKNKKHCQNNIIIPCGEQLGEEGAKQSQFPYELPPLKGAPRRAARRSPVKVRDVIVGVNCTNLNTPRENTNLESRLTYLDKSENRQVGFRSSAKKRNKSNLSSASQNAMSFRLPKLCENYERETESDNVAEYSLFKLPPILGTPWMVSTKTKETLHDVSMETEDNGIIPSTSCSPCDVLLPPLRTNGLGDISARRTKKYGGR